MADLDFAAWLEPTAAWLLTYAVHSTVLLALVWVLGRATGPRTERLIEAGWRFVLIAPLLTTTLQVAGGIDVGWRLPVAGPRPALAGPHEADAPIARSPVAGSPVAGSHPSDAIDATGLQPALPIARSAAPRTDGGGWLASLRTVDWSGWIVGAALLAAVVGLGRLGVRQLRLGAVLRGRSDLRGPWRARLDELAHCTGIRRSIRLTESDRLSSPVAFGVLFPEISVPTGALGRLGQGPGDSLLAHELAHLLRRDPLWLELVSALSALFPWQVLLPVARRRLQMLAEFRCDDLGARLTDSVALAECLVEVASWVRDRSGAEVEIALSGMAVQRAGLDERVERLLDGSPTAFRVPHPAVLAACCAIAVATGAAALPGARPASGPRPAPAPAAPVAERVTDSIPPPSATPEPAVDESDALRDLFAAMLADLDADRAALAAELAELRTLCADRRRDAELDRLLFELDRRLASLAERRAELDRAVDAVLGVRSEPSHSPTETDSVPSDR